MNGPSGPERDPSLAAVDSTLRTPGSSSTWNASASSPATAASEPPGP